MFLVANCVTNGKLKWITQQRKINLHYIFDFIINNFINVANVPDKKGRACAENLEEKVGQATTWSCGVCIVPPSSRQAIITLLFQDISLLYSTNEDTDILLYWLKWLTVHREQYQLCQIKYIKIWRFYIRYALHCKCTDSIVSMASVAPLIMWWHISFGDPI